MSELNRKLTKCKLYINTPVNFQYLSKVLPRNQEFSIYCSWENSTCLKRTKLKKNILFVLNGQLQECSCLGTTSGVDSQNQRKCAVQCRIACADQDKHFFFNIYTIAVTCTTLKIHSPSNNRFKRISIAVTLFPSHFESALN